MAAYLQDCKLQKGYLRIYNHEKWGLLGKCFRDLSNFLCYLSKFLSILSKLRADLSIFIADLGKFRRNLGKFRRDLGKFKRQEVLLLLPYLLCLRMNHVARIHVAVEFFFRQITELQGRFFQGGSFFMGEFSNFCSFFITDMRV